MSEQVDIAVIGAGPAGLAAAEVAAASRWRVVIFEAKPSPARKFLMAGKSGLNLTKNEEIKQVIDSIGYARLDPFLRAFGPEDVWQWAEGLGEPLFTGSSGRVFPEAMKGSPLLRKWLKKLDGMGCILRTRWQWSGWDRDALRFETPDGIRTIEARSTVLALGGASWARLGSDAAWVPWLDAQGIAIKPFRPTNMGFDVAWSEHFRARFAGTPVKPAALGVGDKKRQGEFVISSNGIEGSLVYAISAPLRDALEVGEADLRLDLMPGQSIETVARRLSKPRGKLSLSNHLRKTIGLTGVRAGLLRELGGELPNDVLNLAKLLKSLPIPVVEPRPIDEAISVAGGVAWDSVTDDLMLTAKTGVFIAGEMLDWEAPTGGYLLTACLATGRWAGAAAAKWGR